jgi:hypothetical protein
MDMLPHDIVDLCGIVMDHRPPACTRRGVDPSPLTLTQEDDGIYTLSYRGAVLGWIGSLGTDRTEGKAYRAITASGAVHHCYSLATAKNTIIAAAI